jgi:hypothetical protein
MSHLDYFATCSVVRTRNRTVEYIISEVKHTTKTPIEAMVFRYDTPMAIAVNTMLLRNIILRRLTSCEPISVSTNRCFSVAYDHFI